MKNLKDHLAASVSASREAIATTQKLIEAEESEHNKQVLRELLASQHAQLAAELDDQRRLLEGAGPRVLQATGKPVAGLYPARRYLVLAGLSFLAFLLLVLKRYLSV